MEDIKRVQLSEISELITKGTTPTTLGYEFQDDGVNFLKIECFDENGGFIESKVAHISEECNEKLKRSQLKVGDVLFSIAGAIGRVAIVTEEMLPANTNQALAIIRIANEQVYLPYIRLILTSPIVIEQFEKKKQGVAQLNLSLKDINEISIPLPSKEKQIELAELFDKIDGVIAKRKTEISALDDLIKARFVEMFGDARENPNGYTTVPFIDIIEYMGDIGSNGANKVVVDHLDMKDEEDYAMMVRFTNFTKNDFTDDVKYVSKEAYDFFKKSQIFGGELIICKIGSAGQNYVMPYLNRPVSLGLNQIMVRIKENILMPYLYQYLHTDYGEFLISGCINGAVTKTITKTELKKIPVMLPPMELQNEFAEFVKQVDKSKVAVQKALDETQILFDSLMQKYFG